MQPAIDLELVKICDNDRPENSPTNIITPQPQPIDRKTRFQFMHDKIQETFIRMQATPLMCTVNVLATIFNSPMFEKYEDVDISEFFFEPETIINGLLAFFFTAQISFAYFFQKKKVKIVNQKRYFALAEIFRNGFPYLMTFFENDDKKILENEKKYFKR